MLPIQNKGANGFMEKRVPLPRITGASRTERHASSTANRLPPSSRVIRPVSTISAPLASAGRNRIASRETPKQKAAGAQEERCQRGKVYVAPGEMIAGSDVIKFIAEVAIAAIGRHLQQHS